MTLKFCTVLVALCVPEPRSTDSLGTQHCANFESHSNRVTFETNAISITSSIHAHNSTIPTWTSIEHRVDTRSKMTTVQCTWYRGQQGKEKS